MSLRKDGYCQGSFDRRGPAGVRTRRLGVSARAYSSSEKPHQGVSIRQSILPGEASRMVDSSLANFRAKRSGARITRSRSLFGCTTCVPLASSYPTLPPGPHSRENDDSSLSRNCRVRIAGKLSRFFALRSDLNSCGVASLTIWLYRANPPHRCRRSEPRTPMEIVWLGARLRRTTTHGHFSSAFLIQSGSTRHAASTLVSDKLSNARSWANGDGNMLVINTKHLLGFEPLLFHQRACGDTGCPCFLSRIGESTDISIHSPLSCFIDRLYNRLLHGIDITLCGFDWTINV